MHFMCLCVAILSCVRINDDDDESMMNCLVIKSWPKLSINVTNMYVVTSYAVYTWT